MNWDEYYIEGAKWVATKSKDESTKVGCILVSDSNEVLSTGFNGFPRNCNDDVPERHERPLKYDWFEHAERNAVYNAARNGVMLLGSTAYVTHPPCKDCARGLIQAGIKEVIWPEDNTFENHPEARERHETSNLFAINMLKEAGVETFRI